MGWAARLNAEKNRGQGRSEEDPTSYAARRKAKVSREAGKREARERIASPIPAPAIVAEGVARGLVGHEYNPVVFGAAKDEAPVDEEEKAK